MARKADFNAIINEIPDFLDESLISLDWNRAVTANDHDLMVRLMRMGVSPDQPVTDFSDPALRRLCMSDRPNDDLKTQLETAQTVRMLIQNGAELTVPDHRGLLPADYAIISGNDALAHEVVLGTMRHQIDNGQRVFYPALDRLFASTILADGQRQRAFENYIENRSMLADYMTSVQFTSYAFDPLINLVEPEDFDAWTMPELRTMESLPTPDPELAGAKQSYRDLFNFNTRKMSMGTLTQEDYDNLKEKADRLLLTERNCLHPLPRP